MILNHPLGIISNLALGMHPNHALGMHPNHASGMHPNHTLHTYPNNALGMHSNHSLDTIPKRNTPNNVLPIYTGVLISRIIPFIHRNITEREGNVPRETAVLYERENETTFHTYLYVLLLLLRFRFSMHEAVFITDIQRDGHGFKCGRCSCEYTLRKYNFIIIYY